MRVKALFLSLTAIAVAVEMHHPIRPTAQLAVITIYNVLVHRTPLEKAIVTPVLGERNLSLVPANLDLSVFRIFAMTERRRLEFRTEAFNVTNAPIWAAPGASISVPALFGVVNSTATSGYSPRQLQFALKFYY